MRTGELQAWPGGASPPPRDVSRGGDGGGCTGSNAGPLGREETCQGAPKLCQMTKLQEFNNSVVFMQLGICDWPSSRLTRHVN